MWQREGEIREDMKDCISEGGGLIALMRCGNWIKEGGGERKKSKRLYFINSHSFTQFFV